MHYALFKLMPRRIRQILNVRAMLIFLTFQITAVQVWFIHLARNLAIYFVEFERRTSLADIL